MDIFEKAKWIWYTDRVTPDSYGDFTEKFSYCSGRVLCHLSADGDYTLFVNGKYASSGQYGDFEHYKIYDSIDITDLLHPGENELFVLVWHLGIDTQRYRRGTAGLIYSLEKDGEIIAVSSTDTLCREDPYYRSNYCKMITRQLGQSFFYDAGGKETEFHSSVSVNKKATLFPRPIKKSELHRELPMKLIKHEGKHFLVDLGQETVGLPVLSFRSERPQKLLVTWGEHIEDGEVRRNIGDRDFSFEYMAKAGENNYTNYMLRLGGRYMEVFCQEDIELHYCGIIPQLYPAEGIARNFDSELDRKIYDLSVRTLRLCMMEHYVDTPWREQCFYSYDSRNQMLCGYKVFEGGNFEYARAGLRLIAEDRRPDGHLSICFPCGGNLTIPSFSLHYFTDVREYMEASGDLSLGHEVCGKLTSLVDIFMAQMKNGLLSSFYGEDYWNFYDWSLYNDAPIGIANSQTDLMINLLFVTALQNYGRIAEMLGKDFPYSHVVTELKKEIDRVFFDKDEGLYSMLPGEKQFSELSNSIAVLAEVAEGDIAEHIAEKLSRGELAECSLSMKCHKYDAMLKVSESYREAVLKEIRETYKVMVDYGATSLWEVKEGAEAFHRAGSLCHGWSPIPVLYL